MKAIYFDSPQAFRKWLSANHKKETELLVGFYKKKTGKPTMTWSESVDEALCYGWIDGVRRGVDDDRYTIRFTPRKSDSNWSKINVAKMAALEAEGRMRKPGREAYERRKPDKTGIYSYEKEKEGLPADMLKRFHKRKKAWKNYEAMPPSYRRAAEHWVTSAKREETRERRLGTLVECSEANERIPPLRWVKKT